MQTFKDAKVFICGQEMKELTLESIEFESDEDAVPSAVLPRGDRMLTWSTPITEKEATWFAFLGFRLIKEGGFLHCTSAASPVQVVPFPMLRRVCIGVQMWRAVADWILPLHRRPSLSGYWHKALAARYWVSTLDANGKPLGGVRGFFMPGNQREVLETYDRIRREAGDFDADELGGLN